MRPNSSSSQDIWPGQAKVVQRGRDWNGDFEEGRVSPTKSLNRAANYRKGGGGGREASSGLSTGKGRGTEGKMKYSRKVENVRRLTRRVY